MTGVGPAASIGVTHVLPAAVREGPTGRVVLLNGTSSSGKSSIAVELLRTLDGTWFHLGVDMFHRMRARRDWSDEEFLPVFQRTVLGFHRAVAGMARAGNDVVVDHVLGEDWRLDDCLTVLDGVPVLFVGLRCGLPELERRESGRDRTPGLAALQLPLVHRHGRYDVEVDTEHRTPEECAAAVRERLEQGPGAAFDELRRARSAATDR